MGWRPLHAPFGPDPNAADEVGLAVEMPSSGPFPEQAATVSFDPKRGQLSTLGRL